MPVRRIKEEDLPQLLALYQHLHPDDVAASRENIEKAWQKIMRNEDIFFYFVIEQDEKLVCSCNLTIIPNLTRGARSIGIIENVVTHSDYRYKGLGKSIIEAALAYAQKENCYKIMLMSGSHRTDSHKFYQAIGFSSDAKVGFSKKLF